MVKGEPIRVLQLGSPSGLYGAERWIMALVRHLDPTKVESHVAVIRDEGAVDPPLIKVAADAGFKTHIINALGRFNWSAVTKLRALIRSERIDVVHSHGYKTDIAALLAARGTNARIVTTPHGWSVDAGWKLALYEKIDRAIYPWFNAVVPLSDALHGGLAGRVGLARNLHLIPNGVDISEIDAIDGAVPELEQWRTQGDFIVGYIGQLITRKGLPTLLRGFADWQHPAKRLVILGEGDQRAALEALAVELGIADRVYLMGFREDRLRWLKSFDLFVLPSTLEGIPRCLMEAMAARVPIIATDIDGTRDIVIHGQTGILFPVGDSVALSGWLQHASDARLRSSWATNARMHVEQYHSGAAMAAQYSDLFRNLMAGPRR